MGRQIGPAAGASRRIRPALLLLVNRLDAGLRALRGRQMVELPPVQPVTDANLEFRHLVEHVELGERDAVDAGDLARLADQAGVEPAAAARPPVTVPNSWPRSPIILPVPSELGRERPLPTRVV